MRCDWLSMLATSPFGRRERSRKFIALYNEILSNVPTNAELVQPYYYKRHTVTLETSAHGAANPSSPFMKVTLLATSCACLLIALMPYQNYLI